MGLTHNALHLVVDALGGLGRVVLVARVVAAQEHLVVGLAKDLRSQVVAHAVARDHLARHLGSALEVVGSAGSDVVAEQLLGRAASQKHGNLVEHAVSRLKVAVFLRHLHGVAQRLPACDDRNLVHGVGVLEHVAHQSVTALVVGDGLALVLRNDARLALRTRHDALHGLLYLAERDHGLAPACREQRGLVHEVGQVCAREAGRQLGDALVIDGAVQRLVQAVHAQDLLAALYVGAVDRHATVKAAGTKQGRVKNVGTVGGRDENHRLVVLEAVHLDKQLVERLFALVVAAAQAGTTLAADRVDLVDEDDGRSLFLGLLEEVAYAGGAHAHEHLHKVRATDGEERYARLAGNRLGKKGLARSRRANQQHAARNLGAHLLVASRLGKEVLNLLELLDSLVDARDVGKLGLGSRLLGGARVVRAAKVHGATVLTVDLVHEVHERHDHDDRRQDGGNQRLPQL